ncbi:MAG TPA: cytochrome c3 family protein [Polyangiaceae bacterium]|nr:cytochrome c3 family protein [Polyangiaceae bacterium]
MNSRANLILLLSLLLSLCAALGAAACRDVGPTRFPHAVHLAELDCGKPGKPDCLSCNSCHAISAHGRADKMPDEALCKSCHTSDARQVLASLHTVPERPSGTIAFDHDQHLQLPGMQGQCVHCHAGVVRPDSAAMPSMQSCFGCHEHESEWKQGTCTPCHQRRDLEHSLPQTFLRHDQNFARHHGEMALEQKNLCQSCHSQADCQSCHDVTQDLAIEKRHPERIEANFVHRGDFMVRHGIEAQAQPSRCATCHTPQTCDSCHVERGVSGNLLAGRNPQPAGWVGTNANSHSFHGTEARRDILACASCHEQGPATNCIRCHKVGAYGGNPHPHGWKSARSESAEMCRYCHG